MDKIEKIPIPEDVKRVLDDVSHILIGLNYRETARDYKQAVEKLISLLEAEDPDKSLEEEFSRIWDKELSGECDTEAAFKVARHFAEWQKEQMLKDAVEGEVYKFAHYSYVKERNRDDLTKYLSKFNDGDKVRIVVLKEEEE